MRTFRDSYRWIVAAALAVCAMAVQAVPITGSISMLGGFTPVNSNWLATNLGSATGLDFDPSGTGGSMIVNSATGNFSTLSPFPVNGTIKDIQFSPLGSRGPTPGSTVTGSVTNFWSVGGFSFALNSISVGFQSNSLVFLSGTGVVTGGAGTTATLGNWSLSGQTTSGAGIFSWSSTGAASGVAVAEPGALALLGIGLVAIGAVRFRLSATA